MGDGRVAFHHRLPSFSRTGSWVSQAGMRRTFKPPLGMILSAREKNQGQTRGLNMGNNRYTTNIWYFIDIFKWSIIVTYVEAIKEHKSELWHLDILDGFRGHEVSYLETHPNSKVPRSLKFCDILGWTNRTTPIPDLSKLKHAQAVSSQPVCWKLEVMVCHGPWIILANDSRAEDGWGLHSASFPSAKSRLLKC